MAATAAHVQAQEANSDDPALLEEVVVYGIKQSLQDARDIKREAATVKDVITASDIGALPDKSVTEALQRVPGVAIERFEASSDPDHFNVEGGGVTVRGLNRVRSEFNGRDSFSAGADGRMDFSDIAPEVVASVEVVKNQTADLVEGGTAGTVNIITRKPFDKEEFQAAVSVKGSYGDLVEKVDPNVSGVISNVWDTDAGKFGALFAVAASTTTSRGDGVGVYNYYEIRERMMETEILTDSNGTNFTRQVPAFERDENGELVMQDDGNGNQIPVELYDYNTGVIAPMAGRINQQVNERDRLSLSGALQYANPSESFEATLEFIRSDSQLAWTDRYIEFAEQPFAGGAGADNFSLEDDAKIECHEPNSVGVDCQFARGTINTPWYSNGTRTRDESRTINDISLMLEFQPTDNLKVNADFQFVSAENEIDDMSALGRFESDTYLDLTHPDAPVVEFTNPNLGDGGQYFTRAAMDHVSRNEGEQSAFALDAEYTFDDSWITAIKGGMRVSSKETTVKESDYNWAAMTPEWFGDGITYFDDANGGEYFEQFAFENQFDNIGLTQNNTFWMLKEDAIRDSEAFFTNFQNDGLYRMPSWSGEGDLNPATGQRNDQWAPISYRSNGVDADGNAKPLIDGKFLDSEVFVTEEDRSAVYIRTDFEGDAGDSRYSGNFGLRYVSYQLSSTGSVQFPTLTDANAQDPTLDPALSSDQLAFMNGAFYTTAQKAEEFTRVLPSLNIKYELTEDLIVRFGASEGIYLPEINDVRAQLNIGEQIDPIEKEPAPTPDEIAAGVNPYSGVDFNGYTANAGNPFLQPEVTASYDLAFEYYFGDLGSLTSTFFHKKTRDAWRRGTQLVDIENNGVTQQIQLTSRFNQGSSTVQGFELAAQSTLAFAHESLESFGFQASYTFIDGSFDKEGESVADGDGQAFRVFTSKDIEGLSKENINIQLYYDDGGTFQTRLAYSWRSSWLLNARDVIAFSPVYGEATGQLDWSASYQVTDQIKVGVDANNLLNEVVKTTVQYNQEGVRTPRSYFVNDRRFGLYVQASF